MMPLSRARNRERMRLVRLLKRDREDQAARDRIAAAWVAGGRLGTLRVGRTTYVMTERDRAWVATWEARTSRESRGELESPHVASDREG